MMRERTAFNPERFRVATLDECALYGRGRGLVERGLRAPPIAGGAGYALVGSIGAVSTATLATVTPAWGTSETRAANNLLVCWVVTFGNLTLSAPAGWSVAAQTTSGISVNVFYKIAAGGDAAPTVGSASFDNAAMLAEFSGNATASVLDRTATGGASATSPVVGTAAGVDAASGELLICCGGASYTTAATKTLTHTVNNTTPTISTNNATSTIDHYSFGYGITTANAAADSDSFAFTTTKVSFGGVAIASFKLPAVVMAPRPVYVTNPNAMNRAATW